jgi:hypothetical protein
VLLLALLRVRPRAPGVPDSVEVYTLGRDRLRSGFLVAVGIPALAAAAYTLVDTIVVRPALGLWFLAEGAAVVLIAALPIGGSWIPMRINAAGVLGMLWLLASPLLLIMAYSASACGCARSTLTYIPPALFGILDTRSIALIAILSPVLMIVAAALPPHPDRSVASSPS